MKIMLILALLGIGSLIYFAVLGYRRILIWRLRNKLYDLVSVRDGYPVVLWEDQKAFNRLFDKIVFLLTEFKNYELILLFQEFIATAESTIYYYLAEPKNRVHLDLSTVHILLQDLGYSPFYKQIIPERDAIENGDIIGGGVITNIYLTPLDTIPLHFLDNYYERTREIFSFLANDLSIRSKVEKFIKEYKTLLYLQSVYGDVIPFRETKKAVIAEFSRFVYVAWYSVLHYSFPVGDIEFLSEEVDGEETLEYLPAVLQLKQEMKVLLQKDLEQKN